MSSNMDILKAKMAAMKAAKVNGSAAATPLRFQPPELKAIEIPKVFSGISDNFSKLDNVVDKPKIVDLIGDDIAEQTKTINPEIEGKIIFSRIEKLEQALEAEIPEYASILHTIHRALSKDDELTHLLSDEQIGVLIRAMKERKNVVLVEEKKSKQAKKPLSKTTLDDIL